MIQMIFCVHRLSSLTVEQFHTYWREHHAPMVRKRAEVLRIRRYAQHRAAAPETAEVLAGVRGAPPAYDGVATLWFDNLEDLRASGATSEGRRAARELLEDERSFIDLELSPIFLTEEDLIF
jgi:uncharacterized protein (TIGR02118 family)